MVACLLITSGVNGVNLDTSAHVGFITAMSLSEEAILLYQKESRNLDPLVVDGRWS